MVGGIIQGTAGNGNRRRKKTLDGDRHPGYTLHNIFRKGALHMAMYMMYGADKKTEAGKGCGYYFAYSRMKSGEK